MSQHVKLAVEAASNILSNSLAAVCPAKSASVGGSGGSKALIRLNQSSTYFRLHSNIFVPRIAIVHDRIDLQNSSKLVKVLTNGYLNYLASLEAQKLCRFDMIPFSPQTLIPQLAKIEAESPSAVSSVEIENDANLPNFYKPSVNSDSEGRQQQKSEKSSSSEDAKKTEEKKDNNKGEGSTAPKVNQRSYFNAIVLIQNGAFQNEMKEYRLRLKLIEQGYRVVEHSHLASMNTPEEIEAYLKACAIDPLLCFGEAVKLKNVLDEKCCRMGNKGGGGWTGDSSVPQQPQGSSTSSSSGGVFEKGSPQQQKFDSEANTSPLHSVRVYSGGKEQHVLEWRNGLEKCQMNTGAFVQELERDMKEGNQGRPSYTAQSPIVYSRAIPSLEEILNDEDDNEEEGKNEKHNKKHKKHHQQQQQNKKSKTEQEEMKKKPNYAELHPQHHHHHRTAIKRHGFGCGFPVGEVISEAAYLHDLNGSASCFAFPNTSRIMTFPSEPFQIFVEDGILKDVSSTAPKSFLDLLKLVQEEEGGVCVLRELGIGLNKALSQTRRLSDVMAYERQFGIHISMGKRHPLFHPKFSSTHPKAINLKRKDGKFHLDLFLDATKLTLYDNVNQEETMLMNFQ